MATQQATSISVLLASQACIYREGIERFLSTKDGVCLAGSVESRWECLAFFEENSPDVLVVDFQLKESLPTIRDVRSIAPSSAPIVVGVPCEDRHMVACAQAGAGFVTTEGTLSDLEDTIRRSLDTQRAITPAISRNLFRWAKEISSGPGLLTNRESEISNCLARGLSTKEISSELGISPSTVKAHLSRIFVKLNVRNRASAAAVLLGSTSTSGPKD